MLSRWLGISTEKKIPILYIIINLNYMPKEKVIFPYMDDLTSGLYDDRIDNRDYDFENDICGGGPMFKPEWERGYLLEPYQKKIVRIEHQGKSLTCVGQAYSKYAEVLNWFDVKEIQDLSSRDLYSRIYLPQGGASLSTGVKELVKKGVNLESDVPSYDQNGIALSESEFRSVNRTQELKEKALHFKGLSYYTVRPDIELMAMAVVMGHGFVFGARGNNKGWASGYVKYLANSWGHAIYAIGYGIKDDKKGIYFANSWGKVWGEDGIGFIDEDYFKTKMVFPGRVIIDNPNIEDSLPMNTIQKKGEPPIYIRCDSKKKLIHIADWPCYLRKLAYGQIKSFVQVDELPKGYEIVDEKDALIL